MINLSVNQLTPSVAVDTVACFQVVGPRSMAPIDIFFQNIIDVNKIIDPLKISTNPILGSLAVLGVVSAVESYFRFIISSVIMIDPFAKEACEDHLIPFGSILVRSGGDIHFSDAILEGISFAGSKKIAESVKFLGLDFNKVFKGHLEDTLLEYDKVCQLRHCIVHRFGFLGVKNALQLGLQSHSAFVGQPIMMSYNQVQEQISLCDHLVRNFNSLLFNALIDKRAKANHFSWDLRKDRKMLKEYFDLFSSDTYSSTTMQNYYSALKRYYKPKRKKT